MSLTIDQLAICRALLGGWSLGALLCDFDGHRQHLVASCLGTGRQGLHAQVSRRGFEGSIGDERTSIAEERAVTVTWVELRKWVDSLPTEFRAEALAERAEWGAICRARSDLVTPSSGFNGPSWAEKNVYGPLTERAAAALALDARDHEHRQRNGALCTRVFAWSSEPDDLLELLAVRS